MNLFQRIKDFVIFHFNHSSIFTAIQDLSLTGFVADIGRAFPVADARGPELVALAVWGYRPAIWSDDIYATSQ